MASCQKSARSIRSHKVRLERFGSLSPYDGSLTMVWQLRFYLLERSAQFLGAGPH